MAPFIVFAPLYHLDVIWGISIYHNKLETTINFSLETNHNNCKGCYSPLFVNLLNERCSNVYMKEMKLDINIIQGVHHNWCCHLQWNIKIPLFKLCTCLQRIFFNLQMLSFPKFFKMEIDQDTSNCHCDSSKPMQICHLHANMNKG
jgi:hypothetical protein